LPNTEAGTFKVFVFGTLKEGFPNFYLNKGIKQNGAYKTLKNYLFYLMGERHTPCVFEQKNQGEAIMGELYTVNKQQLDVLDSLERTHEPDGYIRTLIDIQQCENDENIKAYIYLKSANQIQPSDIKLGPINHYTLKHTELYQPRKPSA